MSDIKSVIALLCKHLQLSIDFSIKPEYFRLAKYDEESEEVTQALWTSLHVLSRHVVKNMQIHDDFDRYDKIYATKLYFAFMEYPAIEFYSLPPGDNNACRELLLSLGWLIAAKKALNIAVEAKIATNIFGHENSITHDSLMESKKNHPSSSADAISQMKIIVNRCGLISHNVKGISELMQEKIKLTTKIHAASLNASGLPHLSAREIALAKKTFGKQTADYTKEDEISIKELSSMAMILDTHIQWTKKEHLFYDWMVTVIEKSKKNEDKSSVASECDELSSFVSLLRHVTKKKVHSMNDRETGVKEARYFDDPCVSRFLRIQQEGTEAEEWISRTSEQLDSTELDVEKKMNKLTAELRKMLKSMPNCVEI